MLYACDSRWWTAYGEEAFAVVTGECWTADIQAARLMRLNRVEAVDENGLSLRPGRINLGGHSGYQAIGLAFMWGAARIILLGYDLQRTGGKSHWHGDHDKSLPNLGHLDDWVARMVPLAADLRRQGVVVVNASRATALTAFERATPEAAFAATSAPVYLHGMQGLGDNIYQRAVIRELAKTKTVYLQTPWPQLYADLPVRCVRPSTILRTQAKNIARWTGWAEPPRSVLPRHITYAGSEGTILKCLCSAFGVRADRLTFDLPPLPKQERKSYIVIRPATIRTEWPADSRNPLPEYLAMAAEKLRQHFRIISVADLSPGVEWPVLPLPYADETFHRGELKVEQLLSLVAGAAAVVGGVGWLVPAAVAAQVPMLLIFGGWGRHNGPARIFDPRMNTELIHQVIPERFCMCGTRDHACDKHIAGFEAQFDQWLVGLLAGRPVDLAPGVGDRLVSGEGIAIRPRLLGALPAI